MKKSELRQIIREMVQEELEAISSNKASTLVEKLTIPGYAIKAWAAPEQKTSGSPSFDSVKKGILYPDFSGVLEALKSSELSELGAYEITWIKSSETVE